MTSCVRCAKDERGVTTITINRPEKHNALNPELINALVAAFKEAEEDKGSRLIVLAAEGKSFCSGADLAWMQASADYNEEQNRQDAQFIEILMQTVYNCTQPVIAKVNGPAYGGGVGLLACCDIVVCSDQAKFAFTEVRLGLIPAVISPYVVSAIGSRQAQRLFMTAERFTANQALEFGLVHEVCDQTQIESTVMRHIMALLKAGPQALKECKALVRQLADTNRDIDLPQWIARIRASDEGQIGLKAFLNKTNPPWLG